MIVVLLLFYLLLFANHIESKIFRGTVSSRQAWNEKGQFVAKFGFHDRDALFTYKTNATTDGRWYFILDENWLEALTETDCNKKIAMARFSMAVATTSGQQQFSQWIRPHFWFVVYADPSTCGAGEPPSDQAIEYTLTFLNPDSNHMATDHFGEEQRGLLTFYLVLVLVYIAGLALYTHTVWRTIRKGGPMHETLKMLSVAMGLHFVSTILMFLYLWSFSVDGEGFQFLETSSVLLEELAQCHTVWMLLGLSAGWTLHLTADIRDKGQLVVTATVTLLHVILVLWEKSYKESHYTYHIHESPPGWLMAVLRLGLAALFANNLHDSIGRERSTLKKDFYRSFSIWCYIWFLSFPALIVITMVLPEYWRHRAMTIGGIIVQTAALSLLSRLFLSRSLYWEVSTLSSTTLPLKRDRGS